MKPFKFEGSRAFANEFQAMNVTSREIQSTCENCIQKSVLRILREKVKELYRSLIISLISFISRASKKAHNEFKIKVCACTVIRVNWFL